MSDGLELIKKLNVVPEGKPPWLSYSKYREFRKLFSAVDPPTKGETVRPGYANLHDFLVRVAKLNVPLNEQSIHVNAWVLSSRGYKIEELTEAEYHNLTELMEGTAEADMDDLILHEFGNHRNLYNYLVKELGIEVEAGRGPVFQRARLLLENHNNSSDK
jgi:hypothetical protein